MHHNRKAAVSEAITTCNCEKGLNFPANFCLPSPPPPPPPHTHKRKMMLLILVCWCLNPFATIYNNFQQTSPLNSRREKSLLPKILGQLKPEPSNECKILKFYRKVIQTHMIAFHISTCAIFPRFFLFQLTFEFLIISQTLTFSD